jgi:predicted permease
MNELLRRLQYLLNRRRYDRELESDMQFHREMAAQSQRANFGNLLRLREEAREAWGWTWIDRLAQDMSYGFRIMARSPGFTTTAVLVLAIGIGINVAAFELFDMVALKPLPVRGPERLVRLERRSPNAYSTEMAFPSVEFYRDHAKTLSAAMAVLGVPPMQINDDLVGTSASFVTPNYFMELGTQAAYGRMFNPTREGAPGALPVALISYALWQRRFAGDPTVIGRAMRLNGKPVTIIGVTPFALATLGGQYPDIWLPMAEQPYFVDGSKVLSDFNDSSVRMWGRLAPGVSAKMAEQELASLTNELRREHPSAVWDKEFIQSSPGGHLQVMQPEMYQVAAMAGVLTLLTLAVECGNLGVLLLARAVQREREMGIRLAIGASRLRIFRQLCTESLMLASFGALAGLALGCALMRAALNVLDAPKLLSSAPDIRVVLATVGLTFVSALFFGLAPALQVARQRQHKTRVRQILMGAQVAASCVLLIVSGLLVRAAHHALYTDPGFGYERLISIDAQLAQHGYSAGAAKAYLDQMQARLLALPGVQSVSLVQLPPLGHTVSRERRNIDGRTVMLYPNWVGPRFFETMQIPVLLGRTFSPGDKNVVIVSQSFAQARWPGQNPLGKQVGDERQKDTVIGVVGDAHVNALSDDDATEQYWPAAQGQMPGMVLMVRTAGAVESLPSAAKSISQKIDPKLFPEIREIRTLYRDNVLVVEQLAGAITLMGLVAVTLASVGVIGLVSFTVWQKTKEFGIRFALGASRSHVLRAILQQFVWPVLFGVMAGTGAAVAGSKLLRRALFGISNLDAIGYGTAIGTLLVILFIAAVVPARRALRINVARALRYE